MKYWHLFVFFTFYPRDAVALCLFVSLSQASIVKAAEQIELIIAAGLPLAYPTLYYMGLRIPPKIRILPCGSLSQTLDLKCRHGTSTVANVVNFVRPTTIASLSHWASTFVYNTIVFLYTAKLEKRHSCISWAYERWKIQVMYLRISLWVCCLGNILGPSPPVVGVGAYLFNNGAWSLVLSMRKSSCRREWKRNCQMMRTTTMIWTSLAELQVRQLKQFVKQIVQQDITTEKHKTW